MHALHGWGVYRRYLGPDSNFRSVAVRNSLSKHAKQVSLTGRCARVIVRSISADLSTPAVSNICFVHGSHDEFDFGGDLVVLACWAKHRAQESFLSIWGDWNVNLSDPIKGLSCSQKRKREMLSEFCSVLHLGLVIPALSRNQPSLSHCLSTNPLVTAIPVFAAPRVSIECLGAEIPSSEANIFSYLPCEGELKGPLLVDYGIPSTNWQL